MFTTHTVLLTGIISSVPQTGQIKVHNGNIHAIPAAILAAFIPTPPPKIKLLQEEHQVL